MKISGKKIFITGAGGFIGSHLSEALVEMGAEVTAMLHYNSRSDWSNLDFIPSDIKKELKVVKGNVEDSSFMDSETKSHDIVLHLAALIGIPYSYVAPLSYVRTNVQGTVNVLESVRKNDIELMINTSTSETYGTAIYRPIDEKHPLQGQSPYSASKIAADKLSESYFNSFETPVITIRPFNTFGPRQSSRAVIPTIISQLLTNQDLKLGELKATRDFTFVGDTVKGYIKAIESKKLYGEVINLDASSLSPQIAAPHSPENSSDVDDFKNISFDIAYIGACTGAKYTDLMAAASILKNRKVSSNFSLKVAPASLRDQQRAEREGIMRILEDAGAEFLPNSCGICAGYGSDRLLKEQVCISSTARNFKGRMGDPSSKVYLASPYTVAASAIAGTMVDPRDMMES